MKPYAGLIFDESFHYIDHLAPFCSLLNCPLIAYEESIAHACRTFYPHLEVLQTRALPACMISCYSRPLLDAYLGPWHPPCKAIWLPHGLSDKGWKSPFFEALGGEDLLLVYGQRMRDVLQAKNIRVPQLSIGNFRRHYFDIHRLFYEQLLQKRFGQRRFNLYAPTWEDTENNGTFWEAFPRLLEHAPSDRLLLIKLHPNTERAHLAKIERCKGMVPNHIIFLEDFPPIYPLLERADIYIGDRSSIGYDFLSFQRPMYFLCREKTDAERDPSAHLMRCGEQILLEEIPQLFKKNLPSAAIPKMLAYAFDPIPSNLKESLESWL